MSDLDRLAAYLRQMEELGAGQVFLDEMTSAEVLDLAERAKKERGPAESGQSDTASRAAEPISAPTRNTRSEPPSEESDSSSDALKGLDYESVRSAAMSCTRCALAQGRNSVVFSDGNPSGRLMVVGEAPGANEDRTGLPFVGQAGKLLDLMLASVDLSRRESVYICNVLKCRPPGNRNPQPEEIEACSGFLSRQIALVEPEVILAVGTFAAQWLTGQASPLGRLRGTVYRYEGVPLVVTYHPAALLRNSGWSRAAWDDLQLLRAIMDEGFIPPT